MPLGRRAFSAAALSATLAGVPSPLPAATLAPPSLAQRLATPRFSRLELLKPDLTTSRPDTLHYPSWMLGTWRVENAVVAFSMPLGSAFVDDFVQQSARADVRKAEELSYQLRWVRAPAPAGDGATELAAELAGAATGVAWAPPPRESPPKRLPASSAGVDTVPPDAGPASGANA